MRNTKRRVGSRRKEAPGEAAKDFWGERKVKSETRVKINTCFLNMDMIIYRD